jgi:capsular exopolysaccharide synthesis family protein
MRGSTRRDGAVDGGRSGPRPGANGELVGMAVNVVRRRWRVVALVVAVGLAGTLAGLVTRDRSRAATATVRIPATPDDLQYTDRLTNTYQRLAESAAVRAEVQRRLGGPRGLGLTATPVPNTELMELTARTHSQDLARRAANVWASALVSRVRSDARQDQRAAGAALTSELASSQHQLLRLRRELAGTTDPVRRGDLTEQLRVGELAHQALAQQAATGLNGPDLRNVLSIAEQAAPSGGQWRRIATEVALALLLALSAGVGVAYLLERRNPHLDTLEEIERAAGASVLATIPSFRAGAPGSPARAPRGDSPPVLPKPLRPALNAASVPLAAFGDLRARLLSDDAVSADPGDLDGAPLTSGSPPRTVLVTSARQGDGKSTVAANLAVALSRARHRVLIVDGDLRRPTLHRYFALANDHGLSELLLAPREPSLTGCHAQTAQTPLPKLSVLPAGPRATEAAELLASTRMTALITKLRPDYDFIVIDSPGLATTSDAAAVVPSADAVIFVVGRTPVSDDTIHTARRQLAGWGARTVGIVVNRCGTHPRTHGGAQ